MSNPPFGSCSEIFQASYSFKPTTPGSRHASCTGYILCLAYELPEHPLVAPVICHGGAARLFPAVVFPPDGPQHLGTPPHRRPVLPRRRAASASILSTAATDAGLRRILGSMATTASPPLHFCSACMAWHGMIVSVAQLCTV